MVREDDCGTVACEEVNRNTNKTVFKETFEDKIYGKYLAKDVVVGKETIATADTLIDKVLIKEFKEK